MEGSAAEIGVRFIESDVFHFGNGFGGLEVFENGNDPGTKPPIFGDVVKLYDGFEGFLISNVLKSIQSSHFDFYIFIRF
ncbi:hypothetical protein ES703_91910 [subsurface metagenome]